MIDYKKLIEFLEEFKDEFDADKRNPEIVAWSNQWGCEVDIKDIFLDCKENYIVLELDV